MATQGELLGGR